MAPVATSIPVSVIRQRHSCANDAKHHRQQQRCRIVQVVPSRIMRSASRQLQQRDDRVDDAGTRVVLRKFAAELGELGVVHRVRTVFFYLVRPLRCVRDARCFEPRRQFLVAGPIR